jgi:tetratricopeptide (TPR) repeat protein
MAATWRERRRWLWIALYLGLTAVPALVALVGLRYRLPMVIGWLLLAAPAPAAAFGLASARRWRRLGGLALLFALVFGFAHLRRHEPSRRFGEEEAFTAVSALELGEIARAESASLRAQREAPESSLGWYALARVRERQARPEEAERLYREAIERDPSALAPRAYLAELLLSQRRVEPARAELEALLELNPIYQPALDRIAEVEAASGRLDRARAHWLRLATLGRGHASAWRRVGQIDGARGEFQSGLEAARAAIALEPDRSDGWQLLGYLAVEAGELATAREALAALRRLEPGAVAGAPVALLDAAVAFLAGEHDGADAKLRAILRSSPGVGQARALLLRNAAARGRREEAEQFLRSLPGPAAPTAPPRPG